MGILEILLVVIIIAWLLGGVVFPVGNLIHLLIVVFIVILIIRAMQGRRL